MTAGAASGAGEGSTAEPAAEDPESASEPAAAGAGAAGNCVVVSQTWLRAGEEHMAAYLRLAADFDRYLTARPGFVRRFLVRSLDDARHLIHWREFTSVEVYEEMTADPQYRDHIAALSRHVDADAYPAGAAVREYGRVVHATERFSPERGDDEMAAGGECDRTAPAGPSGASET